MRTGSLRGSPLARLVPAHHAGHAGPCSVVGVARTRRKKLQTRRCGSAYPNCATCSAHCYGAGGTALSTCCIGPTGDDNINSTQCAVTTGNADRPCLHSIYNCSTSSVLPAAASNTISERISDLISGPPQQYAPAS